MRACVRACACVIVPMFSNDSCIALDYDSGESMTILGNMITHVHIIHGPFSYFQRL